jgi:hypothetical protein
MDAPRTPDRLNTALQRLEPTRSELQRRVSDFQEALLAEVLAYTADCVAESLGEIDRAINDCLIVPRLRHTSPVDVPRIVEATVPLPLRSRVLAAWERDREIARLRAEEAKRRHRPAAVPQPVVRQVAWVGEVPDFKPTDRRMVPLER